MKAMKDFFFSIYSGKPILAAVNVSSFMTWITFIVIHLPWIVGVASGFVYLATSLLAYRLKKLEVLEKEAELSASLKDTAKKVESRLIDLENKKPQG